MSVIKTGKDGLACYSLPEEWMLEEVLLLIDSSFKLQVKSQILVGNR